MKKNSIKFICEDCEKIPVPLEESNENWVVVDNKPCKNCGGKIIIAIKGMEGHEKYFKEKKNEKE